MTGSEQERHAGAGLNQQQRERKVDPDLILSQLLDSRATGKQPTMVELHAPVNIMGDIHGQFDDLLKLFDKCGYPPTKNYLMLGDYVDRGKRSLECICMMLAYKMKYPENVFLLRGNHECASINRIYGFYDECKRRYNIRLWKTFTDCFNCMPVGICSKTEVTLFPFPYKYPTEEAEIQGLNQQFYQVTGIPRVTGAIDAIVEDTIFAMHGGLSPDLKDLDQITKIERPVDVPEWGLVCDLLWADPDEDIAGWGENDRGVSYTFGADVVRQFLERQHLSLIVRAHQVVEDGYQFFARRKPQKPIQRKPIPNKKK